MEEESWRTGGIDVASVGTIEQPEGTAQLRRDRWRSGRCCCRRRRWWLRRCCCGGGLHKARGGAALSGSHCGNSSTPLTALHGPGAGTPPAEGSLASTAPARAAAHLLLPGFLRWWTSLIGRIGISVVVVVTIVARCVLAASCVFSRTAHLLQLALVILTTRRPSGAGSSCAACISRSVRRA